MLLRYRETCLEGIWPGSTHPTRLARHSKTMKAFIAFLTVILWSAVPAAQIARATVTVEGPIFIRPGAETALKVLAIGTELKVLHEETGWAQVEFTDPQFGR